MKLSRKQKEQIEKQIQEYERQEGTKVVEVPFGEDKLELEVDQFVANPDIMNSGVQIVKYLVEKPYLVRGKVVTDIGTGCGIIGVAAALLGARKVYLLDVDEKAVENAKRNVSKFGLDKICECFQSDLFKRYDSREKSEVMIFNHPFFAGEPIKDKEWTRMMLGGTELIERYFRDSKKYSTQEVMHLFPWLVLAENRGCVDNDPEKKCNLYGLEVTKIVEQSPVKQGVQQSAFRIYEIKKKVKGGHR